jgi:hypothetical protein
MECIKLPWAGPDVSEITTHENFRVIKLLTFWGLLLSA